MLKIYKAEEQFSVGECVFILGGFDGIHTGHLKLIKRARALSLPVGILTISGGKMGGELFTLSEREEIFQRENLDFAVEAEFTEDFKNISAENFVKLMLGRMNVKAFVCGKDFRFGKNAAGDGRFIAEHTGIPVYAEDIELDNNGRKISSGALKKYIAAGDIESANSLLVHKFRISGKVIHGREEGRKLGFPTANMIYPEEKVRLKEGVYASEVKVGDNSYGGITNFGAAPTFGVKTELLETHICGFSGDLYGEDITVYPVKRIRDISRFSSVDGLKARLNADIEFLRSLNI